jgi:hypothetical protein
MTEPADVPSMNAQGVSPGDAPTATPRPKTTCAKGCHNLGSDAARAVGIFNPDGPTGYRAKSMPYAPLRATRAEAVADEAAWRCS